jgi:hypothetical protein
MDDQLGQHERDKHCPGILIVCLTRSLIRRSMSASDITVTIYGRCHMIYNASALEPYTPSIATVLWLQQQVTPGQECIALTTGVWCPLN